MARRLDHLLIACGESRLTRSNLNRRRRVATYFYDIILDRYLRGELLDDFALPRKGFAVVTDNTIILYSLESSEIEEGFFGELYFIGELKGENHFCFLPGKHFDHMIQEGEKPYFCYGKDQVFDGGSSILLNRITSKNGGGKNEGCDDSFNSSSRYHPSPEEKEERMNQIREELQQKGIL